MRLMGGDISSILWAAVGRSPGVPVPTTSPTSPISPSPSFGIQFPGRSQQRFSLFLLVLRQPFRHVPQLYAQAILRTRLALPNIVLDGYSQRFGIIDHEEAPAL